VSPVLAQATALTGLSVIDIICFTGYRSDRLRSDPPNSDVPALLAQIDVLIDGLYIAEQNPGIGLRGSANQQFHHLTDRLRDVNFEHLPRNLEISIRDGQIVFVGIPSPHMVQTIEQELAPYLVV
jgi:anaerobic ribonucleoside-triphosphate reductase activating protein